MAKDKNSDTQRIQINKSSKSAIDDTQRLKTSDTQSMKVKKPKLWRIILVGFLLTLLLGAGGGYFGYQRGIIDRLNEKNETILNEAAQQYQYGLQQMNNGNYALAKTHFEYVLEVYPDFPGLTENYTKVMVEIAKTSKATATPAATATPDNRGVETLFAQASQEVQSQQWEAALNTLEALRNSDYTYRTIEVDGLYFTALRYRAIQMILSEGNLEEGMYFLSILEQYAPLDKDSVNYSNVVNLYLTGASYWELHWDKVVYYFEQLYAAMPGLYDGTMTASERYYNGVIYYADELMDEGDECSASEYYAIALAMSPTDSLQSRYDKAYNICHPPTATPTEEVIVETEVPTDEPVADPTATVETPEAPGGGETSGTGSESGEEEG